MPSPQGTLIASRVDQRSKYKAAGSDHKNTFCVCWRNLQQICMPRPYALRRTIKQLAGWWPRPSVKGHQGCGVRLMPPFRTMTSDLVSPHPNNLRETQNFPTVHSFAICSNRRRSMTREHCTLRRRMPQRALGRVGCKLTGSGRTGS